MNLGLISGLLVGIITIVGVIYQIRDSKEKIKCFKGKIGKYSRDGKCTGKFEDFIFRNEGEVVHLDIYLDNDQNYKIQEENLFQFSYYFDVNKKIEGGYEYIIKVDGKDDFFYDDRISSKRLMGNFKIIGISGPRQGWISTYMKPVSIESV